MVLRQKLHETLQKARVDEVELPLLDVDNMDEDDEDNPGESQPSETGTRSSGRTNSQSATQESAAHFSQRGDSRVAKDRRDAGQVDFSSMDDDLRVRRSASEDDNLRKKFESKISKLTQEIEGMAPNMKVRFFLYRDVFSVSSYFLLVT